MLTGPGGRAWLPSRVSPSLAYSMAALSWGRASVYARALLLEHLVAGSKLLKLHAQILSGAAYPRIAHRWQSVSFPLKRCANAIKRRKKKRVKLWFHKVDIQRPRPTLNVRSVPQADIAQRSGEG